MLSRNSDFWMLLAIITPFLAAGIGVALSGKPPRYLSHLGLFMVALVVLNTISMILFIWKGVPPGVWQQTFVNALIAYVVSIFLAFLGYALGLLIKKLR